MELPGHCGACGAAAATRMYRTSIPFFKVRPRSPGWELASDKAAH